MKIFIMSDTHYNHENIIDYCKRPKNHEQLMFNATSQLTSNTCLIHLGDICLGKDDEVHDKYIKPLKCRKILVLGNHDYKSWSWYMENGWDFVCDAVRLEYGGKWIMFSHAPQAWDGVWDINVHGHLHNLNHRFLTFKTHVNGLRLYSPEIEGYKPVELLKFIHKSALDYKRMN